MREYKLKFLNKHTDYRRIKVIFSNKESYYIDKYRHWISIDYCDDETHSILRKIALENIYWILGLDEWDLDSKKDGYISNLKELKERNITHFTNLQSVCGFMSQDELEYIKENFLDDFYKNFSKYPFAVDIKELL